MNQIAKLEACEIENLAGYEAKIKSGLTSFIEVGEALSAIRDQRLYRATHGTFEDYCRERWKMSKRHCDRLIESADVVQNLGPTGPTITSERQARELARVEPERRQEVVEKASVATGGKITAAALKEAAKPTPKTVEVVLEARLAGEEAEADSEQLWRLKSLWAKTGKKDRAAFVEWIQRG